MFFIHHFIHYHHCHHWWMVMMMMIYSWIKAITCLWQWWKRYLTIIMMMISPIIYETPPSTCPFIMDERTEWPNSICNQKVTYAKMCPPPLPRLFQTRNKSKIFFEKRGIVSIVIMLARGFQKKFSIFRIISNYSVLGQKMAILAQKIDFSEILNIWLKSWNYSIIRTKDRFFNDDPNRCDHYHLDC